MYTIRPYLGNTQINYIYLGNNHLLSAYIGTEIVYGDDNKYKEITLHFYKGLNNQYVTDQGITDIVCRVPTPSTYIGSISYCFNDTQTPVSNSYEVKTSAYDLIGTADDNKASSMYSRSYLFDEKKIRINSSTGKFYLGINGKYFPHIKENTTTKHTYYSVFPIPDIDDNSPSAPFWSSYIDNHFGGFFVNGSFDVTYNVPLDVTNYSDVYIYGACTPKVTLPTTPPTTTPKNPNIFLYYNLSYQRNDYIMTTNSEDLSVQAVIDKQIMQYIPEFINLTITIDYIEGGKVAATDKIDIDYLQKPSSTTGINSLFNINPIGYYSSYYKTYVTDKHGSFTQWITGTQRYIPVYSSGMHGPYSTPKFVSFSKTFDNGSYVNFQLNATPPDINKGSDLL